jgi:hypothetical protein
MKKRERHNDASPRLLPGVERVVPVMNMRRQYTIAAASAGGGLLLFAYAVSRVGVASILDGIHRVGWGLVPILALGGIRFVLRTEAWRLCTPVNVRLPHRQALMAFLAGDAVGSVTPLGLVASEPTKVLLVRHHLATVDSVTSLAIDNLVYSASVIVVIAAGVLVLLTSVALPTAIWDWGAVSVAGLVALLVAGAIVVRRGLGSTATSGTSIRARVARVRGAVAQFSAGHPMRVWRVFGLDMLFHVVAVLEAYLTLRWLLGRAAPTITEALLFEALNRVLTVVFKFVPFRVGVDEAASGALAPVLSLHPAAGVSIAVIRKVRSLFWAGIGLALIGVHHARATPATGHRETVRAHRT